MKKQLSGLAGILSVLILFSYGCSDPAVSSEGGENNQLLKQQTSSHQGQAHQQRNFQTHLKGANEVPAVDTRASGDLQAQQGGRRH